MRLVRFCMVGGLFVVAMAATATAGVPQLINFQGILLDSNGDPITTTTNVTFSIWNDPTGGDMLWSETQSVTPDVEARFNVLLGAVSPVPDLALADTAAYLEVMVEAGPAMTPRSKLVTVPYAYRVGTVDGATGGTIEGDVNIEGDVYLTGDTILVGGIQIEPTTRNVIIPHTALVQSNTNGLLYYSHHAAFVDNSRDSLFANVTLPHGATITKVVFHLWSHFGGTAHSLDLAMFRKPYHTFTEPTEMIGHVNQLPPLSDSYDSLVIASFTDPTIDNSKYSYHLRFTIQIPGIEHCRFYGIRIEYIVTSLLP